MSARSLPESTPAGRPSTVSGSRNDTPSARATPSPERMLALGEPRAEGLGEPRADGGMPVSELVRRAEGRGCELRSSSSGLKMPCVAWG
eukprot:5102741-Prymnesium_polylepis.1